MFTWYVLVCGDVITRTDHSIIHFPTAKQAKAWIRKYCNKITSECSIVRRPH